MLRTALILTFLAACTGSDDGTGKHGNRDSGTGDNTDADTDTDADSDADTDADTDTDQPDLTTYEGFTEAHAEAWCRSLAACDLLDDQGYATVADCVTDVTNTFASRACDSYAQAVAARCIADDRDMANRCDTAGTGAPPPVCAQVCSPPPDN
jgi:hypothetical protein